MNDPNTILLDKRIEDALAKKLAGGGGGGYNSDMEARVGKIEGILEGVGQRLSHIDTSLSNLDTKTNTDFRWKIGIFITALLAIFGSAITINLNLSGKIDNLGSSLATKIESVGSQLSTTQINLEKVNGKVDVLIQKVDDSLDKNNKNSLTPAPQNPPK